MAGWCFINGIHCEYPLSFYLYYLLIISIEDLDGAESTRTDLESVLDAINRLDLVLSQLPPIQLTVAVNSLGCDTLRNDTPALLQTPHQQHLLGSLAFALRNLEQRRVGVQGRVCGPETRVARAVDALGSVVGDELGGWVAGVKLNLVDSRDDLNEITVSGFTSEAWSDVP